MTNSVELLANGLTALSILLAARNSVHTWWTGIIGAALFGVTFFEARLYADVALQAFFVATSAIGWWQWLRGAAGAVLPVSRATPRQLGTALAVAALATAGYGALLARFTNAYAPFVDSAILALSVVAQVFLMRRRVENWPVWLIVNTIAVPLYASRGLELTAGLYAAYWVNAWFGWWRWRRLSDVQAMA